MSAAVGSPAPASKCPDFTREFARCVGACAHLLSCLSILLSHRTAAARPPIFALLAARTAFTRCLQPKRLPCAPRPAPLTHSPTGSLRAEPLPLTGWLLVTSSRPIQSSCATGMPADAPACRGAGACGRPCRRLITAPAMCRPNARPQDVDCCFSGRPNIQALSVFPAPTYPHFRLQGQQASSHAQCVPSQLLFDDATRLQQSMWHATHQVSRYPAPPLPPPSAAAGAAAAPRCASCPCLACCFSSATSTCSSLRRCGEGLRSRLSASSGVL